MDKVSICNVALSHLANSTEIQDLDAESSKEAQACRRLFDLTRDEVLRDFPWPFATASAALTLFASNPNTEWGYSYRMPVGKLFFRRILSGVRNDSRQSRVSYRILSDAAGELVYTDMPNAVGEWTKQVVNTELWPADFVAAFTLLLAGRIGPRVAGGDQFKLADRALRLYEQSRNKARANAANEEQYDEEPGSEFERARDGSGSGFTDCR